MVTFVQCVQAYVRHNTDTIDKQFGRIADGFSYISIEILFIYLPSPVKENNLKSSQLCRTAYTHQPLLNHISAASWYYHSNLWYQMCDYSVQSIAPPWSPEWSVRNPVCYTIYILFDYQCSISPHSLAAANRIPWSMIGFRLRMSCCIREIWVNICN